jgi:hypothetical protein
VEDQVPIRSQVGCGKQPAGLDERLKVNRARDERMDLLRIPRQTFSRLQHNAIFDTMASHV